MNIQKKTLEAALFSMILQAEQYTNKISDASAKLDSSDYTEIQKFYIRKDLQKMQITLSELIEAKAEIKSLI